MEACPQMLTYFFVRSKDDRFGVMYAPRMTGGADLRKTRDDEFFCGNDWMERGKKGEKKSGGFYSFYLIFLKK
jgi:hypothetical protein